MSSTCEEEQQLAVQAQHEFERCNYDACLATLSKLSNNRGPDAKILHNKAVVEYCKSKLQRTDEFCRALRDVCSKTSLDLAQVQSVDDADQCVVFYNYAIVRFHLRQYKIALVILDKLFHFIEPMDDGLSQKITFFLIELYIQTHQPKEAMGLISYAENTMLSKTDGKEGSSSSSADEALKSTISQYKARCFIMWKSLKNCKREVKALMTSTNSMTAPLIYLKANIEYLRGNHRKALKLLNSAPEQLSSAVSERGQAMMYQNNMAVVHFALHKPHLGAMYLRKAIEENTRATRPLANANLNKSLNSAPLKALGMSRHYELLYNMGLMMLHCGQPEPAFDCLIETIQLYQINPRLWLRLAECCIMAYKSTNDDDRKLEKKMQVIRESVGSGLHRKLILGSGDQSDKISTDSAALPSTTLEFASLCVKNALLLLPDDPENSTDSVASNSLEAEARGSTDTVLVVAPPGSPLRGTEVSNLRCSVLAAAAYTALCLHDYVPARSYSQQLLRQPRLSPAHKYLGHMYLSEALVALDHITEAVEQLVPDSVTDISVQAPEQPRHDADKNDKNGEQEGPESKGGGAVYLWSPRDVPQARAIMQYNLAVAHAVRGEYNKALDNINKSSQNIGQPYPAQMYYLKIYLELMDGRRKTAVGIIHENFGHVGPSRVSP